MNDRNLTLHQSPRSLCLLLWSSFFSHFSTPSLSLRRINSTVAHRRRTVTAVEHALLPAHVRRRSNVARKITVAVLWRHSLGAAGSDRIELANATESNVSLSRPREGSFADIIDRALEHEFTENDQNEAADPGSFNNSVAEQQAVLETVARVTPNKNDTKDEKSFQLHHVFNRAEDTPMLIDRKDNVFIISNFKSKYPVLQLDLRLISDLVVAIVSATCGGVAFAFAGQPVITGYLLAGSIVGPGGFNFISEMVQVETVAQFGVIFLLFALGLEFSTTKLRVVRAVAVLGGLLQIFLFMCMCGLTVS
ncbi:K(+) efflux antiporter 6, partial [Mucuna pruriens]